MRPLYCTQSITVVHFFSFLQTFNVNTCNCDCTNSNDFLECIASTQIEENGKPLKIWDEKTCKCKCSVSEVECSTGYIYDYQDTCR